MEVFNLASDLNAFLSSARRKNLRISLVPTMGNLHNGHLSLIDAALANSDLVISTIFVNPLQFGPDEDLDAYPRTLQRDIELLQSRECHVLFAPAVSEIYGDSLQSPTLVQVPELTNSLCGASRPGHFDGVTTVVAKLFNLTQPDCAIFGLKDYQQYLVIKKMAADLLMPIEIIGSEIVREESGLALSSRNSYLSTDEKNQATVLYKSLQQVSEQLLSGTRNFSTLQSDATQAINEAGLNCDYFTVCNAATLHEAVADDTSFAILTAAYIGETRLIDNMRVAID